MRALPFPMLAMLRSDYRRVRPVAAWVILGKLLRIIARYLHVRCDAMLLPGRMAMRIDG